MTDVEAFAAAYTAGEPIRAVARRLGLPESTLRRWRARLGLPAPARGSKAAPLTAAERAAAAALYAAFRGPVWGAAYRRVSRRERDNDPAWDADDASQDVWLHALRGRYWQFPRGVAAKFLFRQAAEEARRARRTWRQARLLGVLRALLAGYWHLLPLLSPDDIDAS